MANFPHIWASKGHSEDKRGKSESNPRPCPESLQRHMMDLARAQNCSSELYKLVAYISATESSRLQWFGLSSPNVSEKA